MSIARKHKNAEICGGHRKGREKKRETTKLVSCWSWISSTMVDSRQILAGCLTLTMFALLAHMIKREHFDSVAEVQFPQSCFYFIKKDVEVVAAEFDDSGDPRVDSSTSLW